MKNILFLQSEESDPYEIYSQMLKESPVFWDERNKLWAVYSYEDCKTILGNPAALIPVPGYLGKNRLNDYAERIVGKLVRLSNPPQHEVARQVALKIFEKIKLVPMPDILKSLLPQTLWATEIDWINTVCKRLPALAILKGFEFTDTDIDFVLGKIEQLVKIMSLSKTDEQVNIVNAIAKDFYELTERYIINRNFLQSFVNAYTANTLSKDDILALCVSNFAGLLIQSYDAGKGILSNSLLRLLLNNETKKMNGNDENYFYSSVIETLRFDPPVHNTRRILGETIFVNNQRMEKGEAVLVMLAAANRDPQKFHNPGTYNINRSNNDEHLTFGAGSHSCIAKHFSTKLATDTLLCLFHRYKKIELIEKQIEYEPLINVRLPKELFVLLS